MTPPLQLANAEYVSHSEIGSPPFAFFTSLLLSSLYESNSSSLNISTIVSPFLISFILHRFFVVPDTKLKSMSRSTEALEEGILLVLLHNLFSAYYEKTDYSNFSNNYNKMYFLRSNAETPFHKPLLKKKEWFLFQSDA